jgi:hypothetical protein
MLYHVWAAKTTPSLTLAWRIVACRPGDPPLSRAAAKNANSYTIKLSPILYDTLVHLDLMPYRELSTPEELKAALQGGDRLLIDATERAYHRSQDAAKQREHDSGKKNSIH